MTSSTGPTPPPNLPTSWPRLPALPPTLPELEDKLAQQIAARDALPAELAKAKSELSELEKQPASTKRDRDIKHAKERIAKLEFRQSVLPRRIEATQAEITRLEQQRPPPPARRGHPTDDRFDDPAGRPGSPPRPGGPASSSDPAAATRLKITHLESKLTSLTGRLAEETKTRDDLVAARDRVNARIKDLEKTLPRTREQSEELQRLRGRSLRLTLDLAPVQKRVDELEQRVKHVTAELDQLKATLPKP